MTFARGPWVLPPSPPDQSTRAQEGGGLVLQDRSCGSPVVVGPSWKEKLTNTICRSLRIPDNRIAIHAGQLPSTFDHLSVDEHPPDVLRLRVQHDLADGVKTWGKVHGARIQNDQVGLLPRGQRTYLVRHVQERRAIDRGHAKNLGHRRGNVGPQGCGPLQADRRAHVVEHVARIIGAAIEPESYLDAGLLEGGHTDDPRCQAHVAEGIVEDARIAFVPDVVTLAKGMGNGMPVGACWARTDVAAAFEPGDHGSTYSGGALATSAVVAVIDEMRRIDAPRLAEMQGARLTKALEEIPAVTSVRGSGLLLAAELDGHDAREVCSRLLDAGVVTNAVTPTALRFAPPLTVSDAEIDEAVATLVDVLVSGMSRHLLDIVDFSPDEIRHILDVAGGPVDVAGRPLAGKGAALIFEKPSNRTRHSMEMAVVQLGGHPVYTRGEEVGFDTRETVEDVTRIMAGYHALIAARVFDHSVLERMVAVSDVPIVNMLSDWSHPLQAFADALTMQQALGEIADRVVAWIGDYNNVARSLGEICVLLGATVRSPARTSSDRTTPSWNASTSSPVDAGQRSRRPARSMRSRERTRCTPTRGCRWVRRTTRKPAGGRSRDSPSTRR